MNSLLRIIAAILLFYAPGQIYAAGSIHFFTAAGPILQTSEFRYEGKTRMPDTSTGFGLLLDLASKRGHALALDYYVFDEGYDETDTNDAVEDRATMFLLGYRYHSKSGFYIGGGLSQISFTSTITDFTVRFPAGRTIVDDLEVTYRPILPLVLTLGYAHSYASSFSIGVHYLRSASTNLVADEISYAGTSTNVRSLNLEVEDLSVQALGLLIGFAW